MRRLVPLLLSLAALLVLAAPAAAVELGAAVNDYPLLSNQRPYLETLAEHYDAVTPESAMNIFALQPEEGRWTPEHADAHAAWARSHGKTMHGIPLIWCADNWTPGWVVFKDWTAASMRAWITDYVTTVVQRYRGTVTSWDVVNEPHERDGSVKDCVWSRVLGLEYVDVALRAAHAADPTATLLLNEYQAENPASRKFVATEALAKGLQARGVPLDGIGLQFHLFDTGPFQWQVESTMRRVAALGLKVRVSEMDVPINFLPGATTQDKLRLQGEVYHSVAAACARVSACDRLTTWGFTDNWSFRRPENMALPWDADYGPKPAWWSLVRVLRTPAPAPGDRVPARPGEPVASGDVASRAFTLSWGPAADPDGEAVTYTLEHRAADGSIDWRPLATGLRDPAYAFTTAKLERSGTWIYRVRASDGATDGPWSSDPDPVPVGDGVVGGDEDGGSSGGSSSDAPADAPRLPVPPAAPAPPVPAAAPLPASFAPPLPVATPRPRTVRVGRTGRVTLAVPCPRSARRGCRGRVALTAAGRRLGTGTLRAASGRTARLTVTLSRSARRLLARRRTVRATLRVPGRAPLQLTLTRR